MDGERSLKPGNPGPADAALASQLMPLFKQMVLIRKTDEAIEALDAEALVLHDVYSSLGQEACAVGVISALDLARDIVCTHQRGHAHFLAYSSDVAGLLAEIVGSPDGVCGGIGGSQRLHQDNFYSGGIAGGMAPLAAGIAAAEKQGGSNAVTVVFHGEGTPGQVVLYETMNLAALWQLSILFVIDDDHLLRDPSSATHGHARSAGVAVTDVDGADVIEVRKAASRIIDEVRKSGQPALLYLSTGDQASMSGPVDDPIRRVRAQLDPKWCDEIEASTAAYVARVVAGLKNP